MMDEVVTSETSTEVSRTLMTVLVNASAGELLQRGKNTFATSLQQMLGDRGAEARVTLVKGRYLSKALGEMAASEPSAQLVIAGGDGTISRLLPVLQNLDRPVGILPLGTLNLLAGDIGTGGTVETATAALTKARPRRIDLAEVNGVPFHSNAGLGFLSRMAREREGARQRYPFSKAIGFGIAAIRSMLLTRPIEVLIEVDGRTITEVADAVLVTNNHFEGSPWVRPRLDEGLLEVHLLREGGVGGRMAAAFAVWRGTWRALPSLHSMTCRKVVINRKGKRTSTVAMDGEVRQMNNPLTFRVLPGALRVLAAERADSSS